jgi:hypothetical protein
MFDVNKHVFSKENRKKFEVCNTSAPPVPSGPPSCGGPITLPPLQPTCQQPIPPLPRCNVMTIPPLPPPQSCRPCKPVAAPCSVVPRPPERPCPLDSMGVLNSCGRYGNPSFSNCAGGIAEPYYTETASASCGSCGSCNSCASTSYSQFRSMQDTDLPPSYSSLISCAPCSSFPFPDCPCNSGPMAIPTCQGTFEVVRPYKTDYAGCSSCSYYNPNLNDKGCRSCM